MPLSIQLMFFHPRFEDSVAQRHLIEGVSDLPCVQIRDMYELYPEFQIDVLAEKALLEATDILIFQHPLYWYSCPPLMKQWIDLVLEFGWAYGPQGKALKGKYWLSGVSLGGGRDVYHSDGRNRYTLREFLRPFEQTARLCNMHYLPPFALFGAHKKTNDELKHEGWIYRQWLEWLSMDASHPLQILNQTTEIDYLSELEYPKHGRIIS